MKNIIRFVLVFALFGCVYGQAQAAEVKIEFRLGEMTPTEGLTEMVIPDTDKKVWLYDEVVLSNADIASASVVNNEMGPQIAITFTEGGKNALTKVTEANISKALAIILDGKLLSAPIIREKIEGGNALISGKFTQEEAKRIADGLNSK